MSGVLVLGLVGLLALPACASRPSLLPAPGALQTPGRGEGAAGSAAAVAVEARVGAWSGRPLDLAEHVTPFFVRIENRSQRPVRVRLAEFRLEQRDGRRYGALPPYVPEAGHIGPVADFGPCDGFFVAPHVAALYPWMQPFVGRFDYDPQYYARHENLRRVALPTPDMLGAALPEGVLAPGAVIDGFVYFEALPENTAGVTFAFTLVDAERQEPFGVVRVPFVDAAWLDANAAFERLYPVAGERRAF